MRFSNRNEAGILLANKLSKLYFDKNNTVVIAIPTGGVPVAFEVAKRLMLPLDIILVKKIAAPFNPELSVGAVSEDDETFYNFDLLKYLGIKPEDIVPYKELALEILKKNSNEMRAGHDPISLESKNIILVDDGAVTGATIEMAIEVLKRKKVKSIVVAIPVASPDAAKKLVNLVSDVNFILTPPNLTSIGQWYMDFTTVKTQEVIDTLGELVHEYLPIRDLHSEISTVHHDSL
jgi:putative phosphoribosyl transferase